MAYEDEIATALELIAEAGKLVTWQSKAVNIEESEATPWIPGEDETTEYDNISMVFLPVGRLGFESLRPIKTAPDVQAGNEIALMGAQSFTPSPKDIIIDGDRTLRIKNIVTLAPDGNPILYQIELDV